MLSASGDLVEPRTVPAVPLLAATKGWPHAEAYLGCDQTGIVVRQHDRITSIRCIAEDYPEIGQLLVQSCPESVSIDTAALRAAAKQIGGLADVVEIEVAGNQAAISAGNGGKRHERLADFATTVECETTTDMKLRFDPQYLLDALEGAGGRVVVAINPAKMPAHINPGQPSTSVLMQMREV